MKRQLLLLRHGKSDWSTDAVDFDRPLTKRGKTDPKKIGEWLQQNGLVPDHVVSSPARRARNTAKKCCKAMGIPTQKIAMDQRIYEAGCSDLINVLNDYPNDKRRLLLIGHNPGLEILLEYLVGERMILSNDNKLLPTATLAILEMPDDWHELVDGSAKLIDLIRPKSLPVSADVVSFRP